MRFSTRLFSLAAVTAVCATAYADLGFVDQSSLSNEWVNIPTPLAEQQHPIFQPQQFRVLKSNRVSGYAVRVKQPVSCEQGVQYSGYIDNLETDDHSFFWFFESRNAPKTDPVVLWLNGGPGCSSMMGLWMELGPCLVDKSGNATVVNKHSWNSAANIVFLDQPVNVGYSYGKSKIRNSKQSARDVYSFLQLFLGEFTEYADNPFHISGESYGGHYLPALASEIINKNKVAEAEGLLHIPFESMLIGNGWTEPRTQFKHYESFSCATDSQYKPIFEESECQKMRDAYPRCKLLMDACYRLPSAVTCVPANMYCERTQQGNFDKTGLNPYDIRKECAGDSGLCYEEITAIDKYANDPALRWELGVDDEAGEYSGCTDSVGYRFGLAGDGARDFSKEVAETLNENVRVLLYAGDMDWVCNWYGNKAWSLDMKWPGQQGYRDAKDLPWYNQKTLQPAGEVRSYGNLTFLRVFDAGHMVPYDQPENALDFFTRWLGNEPLAEELA
ncbi:Alpha/Beta hydrolase protein [Fennellomyces sp. T-0311]|nr:Alpha/Beta hydrolase protein [Fennellomyces sp. T-0311]